MPIASDFDTHPRNYSNNTRTAPSCCRERQPHPTVPEDSRRDVDHERGRKRALDQSCAAQVLDCLLFPCCSTRHTNSARRAGTPPATDHSHEDGLLSSFVCVFRLVSYLPLFCATAMYYVVGAMFPLFCVVLGREKSCRHRYSHVFVMFMTMGLFLSGSYNTCKWYSFWSTRTGRN